jgi:hypothetical protein
MQHNISSTAGSGLKLYGNTDFRLSQLAHLNLIFITVGHNVGRCTQCCRLHGRSLRPECTSQRMSVLIREEGAKKSVFSYKQEGQ